MLNEMKILEMFMVKYVAILSALLLGNLSYAAEPYKVGDVFYCVEKANVSKLPKDHNILQSPESRLGKFVFKIVDENTLSFGEGEVRTALITSFTDRRIEAENIIQQIHFVDNFYNEVGVNAAFSYMISAECVRF